MAFRKSGLVCVALLGVAAGFGRAAPAPEVNGVRYRFKAGDKLHYVYEAKTSVVMNFMGMQINQDMNQTLDMAWQVTGIDKDGKAKVTITFERARLKSDGLGGKGEYDSKDGKMPDDATAKRSAEQISLLVDGEITFSLDARGQVSDAKVSEKLAKRLQKAPAQDAGGLNDFQTEDGVKRLLKWLIVALPKGELTKGKAWSDKIEEKTAQGIVTLESKYTYEGAAKRGDKKLEKIVNKPAFTWKTDPNGPIPFNLKTEDAKGVVYLDSATGRLVENQLNLDMKMEVNMGEIQLDCKMKIALTFKLVDKQK
jgi:hypothetical protein